MSRFDCKMICLSASGKGVLCNPHGHDVRVCIFVYSYVEEYLHLPGVCNRVLEIDVAIINIVVT